MRTGRDRLELEGPSTRIHSVAIRDAEIFVVEKDEARWIIRRHPQFASGSVFPEMDVKRDIQARSEDSRLPLMLRSGPILTRQ